MTKESEKKGVGIGEVGGGLVAGAVTTYSGALMGYGTVIQPVKDKANNAVKAAEDAAKKLYTEAAQGLSSMSTTAKVVWVNEQVAADNAVKAAQAAAKKVLNPTSTIGVLSALPTIGKVCLGVAVVGAALGTGYLINRWRNSGEPDNAERLNHAQRYKHQELENQLDRQEQAGQTAPQLPAH